MLGSWKALNLRFVENGSLGQTLKAFGKFNEKLVASYVWKILEGLQYLHSSGVVHCDLKAANILTTKSGNVKLSDFGVSLNLKAMEQIKAEASSTSRRRLEYGMLSEVAGTPNWSASLSLFDPEGGLMSSGTRSHNAHGRFSRLGHLVFGMHDHRTSHGSAAILGHQ